MKLKFKTTAIASSLLALSSAVSGQTISGSEFISVGSSGQSSSGAGSTSLSTNGHVTLDISHDDRYVVFSSLDAGLSTNPVATSNGKRQVFVRDRVNGTTTLISKKWNGSSWDIADDHCGYQNTGGSVSISADGRYVVFDSSASNLHTTADTDGGLEDAFICDRDPDENGIFDEGNEIVLNMDPAVDTQKRRGSRISPAGNRVFFAKELDSNFTYAVIYEVETNGLHSMWNGTNATTLGEVVAGADFTFDGTRIALPQHQRYTNAPVNVYVGYGLWDVDSRTLVTGVGSSCYYPIAQGNFVDVVLSYDLSDNGDQAAISYSINSDVSGQILGYVVVDGTLQQQPNCGASLPFSTAFPPNYSGYGPARMSKDGRHVVFTSNNGLVAGDTNGVSDAYLLIRDPDEDGVYQYWITDYVLLSEADGMPGVAGNGGSRSPVLGLQSVVYESAATDIVSPDTNGSTTDIIATDIDDLVVPIEYAFAILIDSSGSMDIAFQFSLEALARQVEGGQVSTPCNTYDPSNPNNPPYCAQSGHFQTGQTIPLNGTVAIALVDVSAQPTIQVPLTLISDQQSASDLADVIRSTPFNGGAAAAIASGMQIISQPLLRSKYQAANKSIIVIGDNIDDTYSNAQNALDAMADARDDLLSLGFNRIDGIVFIGEAYPNTVGAWTQYLVGGGGIALETHHENRELGFIETELRSSIMRQNCWKDLDGSGSLNILDYIVFGNLYNTSDPKADIDGSGTIDILDYIAYGNAYASDCPDAP